MNTNSDDVKQVENLGKARAAIASELRKSIVGMDDVIMCKKLSQCKILK